ncbi:hypothetical protein GS429_18280 [Natronorubrum sp. JWXQ-INN-674]|uniref:DUF2382 domain-containing protein n=1 Tax=Natronorubrum halalkaliphilum TaxID=2691917 RepID=A0A6B0VR66_9EURY|nr:hypothetical protein [Natronorubrum halalkaliphilum]MXV63974.1 hypothetical protein [Natronorubrum halalkaliphilum]
MGDETASGDPERRMTTDPERIREWAETRDAVPVSIHGGEGHGGGPGHSFVRQGDIGEGHEEYTWDEFTTTFENEDLVFVYRDDEPTGEELGHFELVERETAFDRADLGRTELEDKLRQGETVTTEIVETQVIEREIVERDTIESEVVDTELTERHVVGSELLNREIVDTEFVTADVIEVTTDETRLDTVEEIERYTIESRVVDVDLEHDEEIERGEIETDVELESVQRSILESDVIRSSVSPDEVIEREVIESQRGEGDTVRSELLERRTVEEQIDERTRMRFTLEETELIESEVIGSDIIEGEIIDVAEYGEIETAGVGTETEVTAGESGVTETDAGASGMGEADPETGTGPGTGTGTEAETDTPAIDAGPVELSSHDRGKDVVDETGQQIGIVAEVDGQTAYVDPEPGLADRLKARLNWGSRGDDEYPVEASKINEITNDTVIIQHSGDETATGDHGHDID